MLELTDGSNRGKALPLVFQLQWGRHIAAIVPPLLIIFSNLLDKYANVNMRSRVSRYF